MNANEVNAYLANEDAGHVFHGNQWTMAAFAATDKADNFQHDFTDAAKDKEAADLHLEAARLHDIAAQHAGNDVSHNGEPVHDVHVRMAKANRAAAARLNQWAASGGTQPNETWVTGYLLANAFNPTQARDYHGKWTSTGTHDPVISGGIRDMNDKELKNLMPQYYQQGFRPGVSQMDSGLEKRMASLDKFYQPVNDDGMTTLDRYSDGNGKWSPNRERLHDNIVEGLRGSVPKSTGQPQFTMMGGGSGSGKGTLVKSGLITFPKDQVHIDDDQVKAVLPEYNVLMHAGHSEAAAYVHNESSEVAKRTMAESFKAGQNVLLDGTGDSQLQSVIKKVNDARAAGYAVHGDYVTCPVDTAIARAQARALKTGRTVPEAVIRDTHANVSRIYPAAVKLGAFDDSRLWDNDGEKPVLVAESKGDQLKIHDSAKWQVFLDKGKVLP